MEKKSLHRMTLDLNKPSSVSNSSQAASCSFLLFLLHLVPPQLGFARSLVRWPIKASTDFDGRIVSRLVLIRGGGQRTRSTRQTRDESDENTIEA